MTNQIKSENKPLPTLHMIYGNPDFPKPDQDSLVKAIQDVDPTINDHQIKARWAFQETEKCLGELQFDQHMIRFAGLSNPLPREIIDCTIHPSPWGAQIKAGMRQHQSQLSLVYAGGHHDPVEQMIALYQAAHAFSSEDLLGILNQNAWTAHPPGDYLSPEKIQSYREVIPFNLWVGYVKFFVDEENYWLVTKGHHIFDVPDLAYFLRPGENAEQIINHFINIFYYIFEQDVVVTAGDTLEISKKGQYLRFSEVPEGADFLLGPSGALVIEKITPDDIAQQG